MARACEALHGNLEASVRCREVQISTPLKKRMLVHGIWEVANGYRLSR